MQKPKIILVFLFLSSILFFLWSIFFEPGILIVRQENFYWKFQPIKIALFADLHAGSPHIDMKYIDKIIASLNEQKPDIVLIAGDLAINGVIGGQPLPFDKIAQKISAIKNKYGIYAVLGNHDWWNEPAEIKNQLQKNGVKVLENESILINMDNNFKFNLRCI